jgi:hypothetical protein
LETLVLLAVLDVEKIEGDYLVHLYDVSEGLAAIYASLLRIFGGATSLVGSDFLLGGVGV